LGIDELPLHPLRQESVAQIDLELFVGLGVMDRIVRSIRRAHRQRSNGSRLRQRHFLATAIPTDNVDEEFLGALRRWEIGNLFKFMIFIGPISSIFDYTTFFVMLYVFDAWNNAALFQTGWFVESLLSQTLIIHIIRTAKIPFIQSRASNALIAATLIISAIGCILPFTPLGEALKFTALPLSYWPILAFTLAAYAGLTQAVKVWLAKRWSI
jgi:P-type Mg2+ transporter